MIHTDEDDEFDRIERENKIKGQPYHFEKREWVGLTDEEVNSLRYKRDWTGPWTDMTFARAIEAKLKEKNEKT